MAQNTIPREFASLMVQGGDAYAGATSIGSGIPLLINTAADIGANLTAAQTTQLDYKTVRGGLSGLSATLRTERELAYNFCFTARDLLRVYCGRDWCEAWLVTGFDDGLAVPRSYAELRELLVALNNYFTLNPTHENEAVGITAALANTRRVALQTAHEAINARWMQIETKVQARDAAVTALRKRLSGLCKELSQRLEDMDPRWLAFGFNLPGAPTTPEVPQDVVVTPLTDGRLQVACAPSPTATSYRFYYQRPIVDPAPIAAGSAEDPLFVIEGLTAGQVYQVYVSASNSGATSDLSEPVAATPVLAAAA
jgi:hypothetical protein